MNPLANQSDERGMHTLTETLSCLLKQLQSIPFGHNLKKDMSRRRRTGKKTGDGQLEFLDCGARTFERIEDEASLQRRRFICRERRAETGFNLPRNRRLRKDDQRAICARRRVGSPSFVAGMSFVSRHVSSITRYRLRESYGRPGCFEQEFITSHFYCRMFSRLTAA